MAQLVHPTEPPRDCPACPRLVELRKCNRTVEPDWHNAPVASFGPSNARLLIVGLAPGQRGANRTGRPFTGDYAGELLYGTLIELGFASGLYRADPADGLVLLDCRITNAVRCVPPENKPTPSEIATCRPFLAATIASMPTLSAILALGRIAHDSTLVALGCRRSSFPFAHAGRLEVRSGLTLYSSYHCSRYNTQTGRLTREMFRAVLSDIKAQLSAR